jgi:hypothetical protein
MTTNGRGFAQMPYSGVHRFVAHVTDNPLLELMRLLAEAAGLEHSLMIAYLFAMFSIKDRYKRVRGRVDPHLFMEHRIGGISEERASYVHNYLDVCVEEMQHLSLANGLLGELGAAPNLNPHQFPLPADIYPFELNLESLNRKVVAKYLWIEADDTALDPRAHEGHPEEIAFITAVRNELDLGGVGTAPGVPNHVGSVYRRILECLQRSASIGLLPDRFQYQVWFDRLHALQSQGEIAHYNFFKEQFTGVAFNGDETLWADPRSAYYPANMLVRGTAFDGYPDTIADPSARRVALLANMHYWILLMLLDAGYRSQDRFIRYKAIDGMTQCLWHLGMYLAHQWGVGLPFDQLGRNYGIGRDRDLALQIVRQYVQEARTHMEALSEDNLLPPGYNKAVLQKLYDALPTAGPELPSGVGWTAYLPVLE